jgi:hypothetical protein
MLGGLTIEGGGGLRRGIEGDAVLSLSGGLGWAGERLVGWAGSFVCAAPGWLEHRQTGRVMRGASPIHGTTRPTDMLRRRRLHNHTQPHTTLHNTAFMTMDTWWRS